MMASQVRETYRKIRNMLRAKIGKYAQAYIRNAQGNCVPAHLARQDSHDLLAIGEKFFNKNNFPDQDNWLIAKAIFTTYTVIIGI